MLHAMWEKKKVTSTVRARWTRKYDDQEQIISSLVIMKTIVVSLRIYICSDLNVEAKRSCLKANA